MTLHTVHRMRFFPVAAGIFGLAAGAGGWTDTDVSATTGLDTSKLWVVIAQTGAATITPGARAHGETVDNSTLVYAGATLLSYVNGAGHMDLLQDAGQAINYRIIGYLL